MGGIAPSGTSNPAAVVLVLAVAAIAFGGLLYMNYKKHHPSAEPETAVVTTPGGETMLDPKVYNIDAVYPHPAPPHGAPVVRVFFIGDSYTLVNNLPALLEAVASSDAKGAVDVKTGIFADEHATIGDLWEEGSGRRTLATLPWDYIVLQDMDMLPLSTKGISEMSDDIRKWDADIKAAGAHTVVMETWARKPGSAWYVDKVKYGKLNLGTPESMQDKIDYATNWIAADIGAAIVPAGDYWSACRDMPGMPDLYNPDGTNPSLAGDYLIALLTYRGLTGHDVMNVEYAPPGIPADAARLIRQCAASG